MFICQARHSTESETVGEGEGGECEIANQIGQLAINILIKSSRSLNTSLVSLKWAVHMSLIDWNLLPDLYCNTDTLLLGHLFPGQQWRMILISVRGRVLCLNVFIYAAVPRTRFLHLHVVPRVRDGYRLQFNHYYSFNARPTLHPLWNDTFQTLCIP